MTHFQLFLPPFHSGIMRNNLEINIRVALYKTCQSGLLVVIFRRPIVASQRLLILEA